MTTDATQVTGSALSGGPRPGDVLAERYELLEPVDHEGPSIGFRALDQETERPVLVRVLTRPGLHTDTCDEVVERLRGLVGVGGRFLSSLLDADREGRSPFTVEAFPTGTQLSAIIDSRRGRGEGLGPREVLPVVARLSAALAALPERWHHGDVRPERVWLDTDGLRLTGPYLLVALPHDELSERIEGLGPGVVAYPPETQRGRSGPSGDLWGVAAIAWEALTGRSPDPETHPEELSPALHAALCALLHPSASERPSALTALLDALAAEAGLAVPRLDPEPHQPPTALIGAPPSARPRKIPDAAPEGTQEIAFDQIIEERPLARKIPGAAPEGTQEISFDQIIEEKPTASPDDTAKHAPIVDEPDSLDPRLVRAALGVSLDSDSGEGPLASDEVSQDALDPRLVRAALGITLDSDDSSMEELDELEELEDDAKDARGGPAKPAARPPGAGQPAGAPRPFPGPRPAEKASSRPAPGAFPAPKPGAALGPRPHSAAPSPRAPAPRPQASAPRPQASTPRPEASAPAPRPQPSAPPPHRQASAPAPHAQASAGSRASTPAPGPQPSAPAPQPQASAPHASPPAPQPHAPVRSAGPTAPGPQSPAPRPVSAAPSAAPAPGANRPTFSTPPGTSVTRSRSKPASSRKKMTGLLIVVGAVVLAIAIVGLGFLIAAQRRSEAARARQIEERLQQLRPQQGQSPTPQGEGADPYERWNE